MLVKSPKLINYYGSKGGFVDIYPGPLFDLIVEPFGGGFSYSLRHVSHKRRAIVYETDKNLLSVTRYLQSSSEVDIMSLPNVDIEDNIDDVAKRHGLSPGEAGLIAWWRTGATARPGKRASKKWNEARPKFFWGEHRKRVICALLPMLDHIEVREDDGMSAFYEDFGCPTTFFVDPPYSGKGGDSYKERDINYKELARLCRNYKNGQLIVCEQIGATWLKFNPLVDRSLYGDSYSPAVGTLLKEAIYYKKRLK